MFEDYNADYLRRQGNDVARKYYDWNTQIDEIDAFRHIYINALLRTRHSDKYVKFAGNFQEWITNEADPYHNKGYYNNAIGLSLGKYASIHKLEDSELELLTKYLVDNGYAIVDVNINENPKYSGQDFFELFEVFDSILDLNTPYNKKDYTDTFFPLQAVYYNNNRSIFENLITPFYKSFDSNGIKEDPIVLDIDGNGIKIADNGVYFDYGGDGFAEATAWISGDDGLLVTDKNNNGIIDDSTEILVHDTLVAYDTNNNGVIDENDENINEIKVLRSDGSLQSLLEAGVKFISLNTKETNNTDEYGNTQFAKGTFTKTNGEVYEYGEFLLQTDTTHAIELENISISEDVKLLPFIENYGEMNNLHHAIMKDESGNLKTLVQSFVSETNDDIRMNLVDQILEKWANATEIENGSRGNYIDAKKLAIIEKFIGRNFISTHDGEENPHNPNIEASDLLNTAYENLKLVIYSLLMAQTHLDTVFEKITINYNYEQNHLSVNLLSIISMLKTALNENPILGKELIYQVSKMLKGLCIDKCSNYFDPKDDSCFYTTFTKDDRELKWLIDTIGKVPYTDEIGDGEGSAADDSYRLEEQGHFHSLSGDDVAYGSDEEDSFSMCSGDDLVDAGGGNDIIDTHGGNDIIFAGAGDDIIHSSDGDDIIFAGDGDDTIMPDHGDDFSWDNYGNDTIRGGKGNDTIISMTGDDTFIFNIGDGQDTIIEHQGVDTLYFGPNITWEDLTFTQSENDMVISINDTTDSITVKDWFTADEDGVYRYNNHKIEIFEFADGSKHTKDEITVGNNTESITYNMDEIGEWVETASNYKNTVNLKEGWNDIVAGENSDDTYVLSQEFSDVLIKDYSGNNKIVFDNENITLANTFFAYNENGLEVWFDYFESHLQLNGNNFSFEFSDGTTVTDLFNILTRDVSYTDYVMGNNLQELTLLGNDSVIVTGNDNNNLIRGNYGDTTFVGGLGDDRFESLYNTNDTYVFNINDGNDYIIDLGGNDTIQFGEGITTENINFLKDFENNNLEIWYNLDYENNSHITIENYFGNDNNKIENFVFSDGSTITDVTPYINVYGSQHYSDLILPDNIREGHLRGEGHTTAVGNSLDNQLNGNDGDNTFIGGQGNDSFHDDRETSERYIYNLGDGNDFIYDYGGVDAIIFGEGITKENIRFNKEPENLVIWFDIEGHENDIICIGNYFIDDKNKIELIKFADGSVIENLHQYVSEIYSRDEDIVMGENIYTAGLWDNADLSVTGNNLDNLIMGNAGNNTFEGKTGNDTIIDDQGGNETYIYNLGDGNDHIFDVDGTDKIVFGEGITTQNLVFRQEDNHLIISFAQNEGSIFIENYFGDDINKIETFELSDGTIINDISSYLANSGETTVEPETQQPDEQENNQSQEPEQGENTTPENNSYTYNLGSGDLYIADNGGNDTLTFGQGISLENINFLKSQTNLHIWINDNYGTIQIENYFSDDNCKIESFIFADGTTISDISDYIIGYGSDESIVLDEGLREAHLWGNENTTALGNNQDNHFNGNEGNNTLYGGGGNDSFYDECSSNETYIYNRNNGYDYITDIGGVDTIKFGRDIYSDNTRFERVENNLLISFYDFEGSIEIENYFLNDNYKIENFEFYDGTILTDISDRLTGIPAFENYTIAEDSNIEIVRMAGDGNITVIGNSQDNNIEGNIGDNTFEGKGGNDSLIDVMGGNDTYIYNIGDGNDFIYDLGGNDTIKFGSEVNLDNLAFMQSATDLNIWFHNIENQGLTIKDFFSDPNAKIEKFELSDGTVITDISNYITAIGSEENITLPTGVLQAHLQGEADTTATGNNLDNWIGGNAGNNTITGGLGNDYMFDDQFTNETYIYNLGDGFDAIDDFGGFDTIKFGTGITKENLIFKVNNGDLLINFINSDGEYIEGEIRINGYFNDDNKRIENIEFSDGSVLSDFDSRLSVICGENDIHNYMNLAQIELWGNGDFKATGEYRDEIIHGNSGNNTYDPKGGNDYIYDTQGGNDTYIYNHDYNNKFILDIGGNNDTIKFGTGINVNNTLFIKEDNHLRIYFPESGNSFIRIEDYFLDNDHKIENFVFADNTVITDVSELISGQASEGNITLTSTEKYAYLLGNSNATVIGNNNEENFIYGNAGNNTYNGGLGDDHIEDRLGGDDTYIYNIGDGHDYIIDIGGNDTVKFGEGISLENVRFTHRNNNLQVFVDIGEDGGSINIENYFKSDIRKIEKFEFVDGTVITDVTNLISGISIDSDYTFEENSQINEVYLIGSENHSVTGNSSDNHIEGNSGNNTYQGNGGNDDYYDEEGNETYIYNIGDGFDFINDRNGYDVIKLGEGITQSMLRMNRQDNGNLEIYFEGIEGNICICDFFNDDNCKIEKIILSDNTEITDFTPFYTFKETSENYTIPENSIVSNVYLTGDGNVSVTGNSSDNYIVGNCGNNTYQGNGGNDSFYDEVGNDTYIYNLGDGNDTINDQSGSDTIQFGNGITLDSIGFMKDDYNNLHIRFNDENGSEILIQGQLNEGEQGIETIKFADNTSITNVNSLVNQIGTEFDNIVLPDNYIEAHLWGTSDLNATGNSLDNFMRGNAGNNILNGKAGDDYYWEFEGGNDTYIYNIGDGHDYIADISGNDTIQFGTGITSTNIQFAHNQDNYNNLEISFNGIEGGITIEDYFDENQNKKIENFTFSDGTTISDISSYLNPTPDEYEDEEEPVLPLSQNNEQNFDVNLLIQEMNSYGVDSDVVLTDMQNQNNEDILLAMVS